MGLLDFVVNSSIKSLQSICIIVPICICIIVPTVWDCESLLLVCETTMDIVTEHIEAAECPVGISDHVAESKTSVPSCSTSHQAGPCADIDDLLEDIRLPWVDDPNPTHFTSHRALIRYARELKMITQVMKEYSKLDPKADQGLLDDTLQYG